MKKKENSFKSKKPKSGINKTIPNKTKLKIDELRTRLKVIQLIEHKAAIGFEELIAKNFPEINVRKRYVYDVNNKPILINEDEDYLSIKDLFIWEIRNHFKKNKIIAESKYESQTLSEGVRNAKVISDLNELTDAMIDDVILRYTDVANLVLSLIQITAPEAEARVLLLKKKYEDEIYKFEMQNRKYDIRLFREAKKIYESKKNKRPRTTQAEALILANEKLKIYDTPFRDDHGYDTPDFALMQDAFRREIYDL